MREATSELVLFFYRVLTCLLSYFAVTSVYFRAADWKLDTPDWTGRMRLVSVADKLVLKLEDKSNGE